MSNLTDLIDQLRVSRLSSAIQTIYARVDTFIATLQDIAAGVIPTGPAGGDLAGTYPNPTVDGIQGNPVSAGVATTNQAYVFDGANLTLSRVGGLIAVQVFATSGTYTPTTGARAARIRIWGAGGGGGGAKTSAGNGTLAKSASGGSYSEHLLIPPTSQTVTIGAKGTGGSTVGGNGTDGGASSFGAILTAPGGLLGTGDAAGAATAATVSGATAPANATGGNIANVPGQAGGISLRSAAGVAPIFTQAGGLCFCGNGAMGAQGLSTAGTAASGFGNGGSAACETTAVGKGGGNGSDGYCIIEEYA